MERAGYTTSSVHEVETDRIVHAISRVFCSERITILERLIADDKANSEQRAKDMEQRFADDKANSEQRAKDMEQRNEEFKAKIMKDIDDRFIAWQKATIEHKFASRKAITSIITVCSNFVRSSFVRH